MPSVRSVWQCLRTFVLFRFVSIAIGSPVIVTRQKLGDSCPADFPVTYHQYCLPHQEVKEKCYLSEQCMGGSVCYDSVISPDSVLFWRKGTCRCIGDEVFSEKLSKCLYLPESLPLSKVKACESDRICLEWDFNYLCVNETCQCRDGFRFTTETGVCEHQDTYNQLHNYKKFLIVAFVGMGITFGVVWSWGTRFKRDDEEEIKEKDKVLLDYFD